MESESDNTTRRPAPHRRSPLGYLNYMSGARGLRGAFTGEKLGESLRTLVWVVPITLLIWIYAEREQIVYPESGPNASNILIRFVPSEGFAIEPSNGQQTVNLKLTGPKDSIDHVRDLLTQGDRKGVPIDLGQALKPGDNQPINVVEHIQNFSTFKNNGVTVVDSQPPNISVNIDSIVTREFPVELATADRQTLSQSRFNPPKVSVQGPSKLLNNQHVIAVLSQAIKAAGENPAQTVPVELATQNPFLTLSPSKVSATLVAQASDKTTTVRSIALWVHVSAGTLKTYDVLSVNGGDDTLGTTELVGPPEQIDSINSAKYVPRATLELSTDDFLHQEPKQVRYELPPGVRVVGEGANRRVDFKMALHASAG